MKVTFFDVEYANIRNKSICQIGLLSKTLGNDDIIKGIIIDDVITDDECNKLNNWLYENNYLA